MVIVHTGSAAVVGGGTVGAGDDAGDARTGGPVGAGRVVVGCVADDDGARAWTDFDGPEVEVTTAATMAPTRRTATERLANQRGFSPCFGARRFVELAAWYFSESGGTSAQLAPVQRLRPDHSAPVQ